MCVKPSYARVRRTGDSKPGPEQTFLPLLIADFRRAVVNSTLLSDELSGILRSSLYNCSKIGI